MARVVIDLEEGVEARLREEARRAGVSFEEHLKRLLQPTSSLSAEELALFKEDFEHYRSVYERLAQ